jgi:arylformamidase
MIYDISLPLDGTVAPWPGDAPYRFERNWQISEGASVNVGSLAMSVHYGTHIDAPYHFAETGTRAGALDLSPYWGNAIVLDMSSYGADGEIGWDAFADLDFARTPRLLMRTDSWKDHTTFPDTVPVLAADVPALLAARGVALIGIDVPSVDRIDSKNLPNHHALQRAGIAILESLNLAGVAPGVYELCALPLRLIDADGAPVRAVLRRE